MVFSRALSVNVYQVRLCCLNYAADTLTTTQRPLLKYPFSLLCFLTFIYGFLSLSVSLSGSTYQVSMLHPLCLINEDSAGKWCFFFSTTVKTSAQIFSVCAHTHTPTSTERKNPQCISENEMFTCKHSIFWKCLTWVLFSCVGLYH